MRTKLGALAITLAVAGTTAAETVERIVAKVNGEIITLSELEEEVQIALERLGPAPSPEEEVQRREELRKQILNRMIDNKLVLQIAEDRGLRVPPRFFDEWKQGVMEQMQIQDEEDFVRQVELQGTSVETLRRNFEESLLVQEVRRMEVDSKVSVSEPEIEERYRQNIQEYTEPAKVRLREIVVKFDDSNEIEKGQKARRLLQDIRQGADFAEVARMHSESGSREAGGDLGMWDEGDLMDELAEVAFELNPGEVSDIIRLPSAFYIIRVEEKVEERIKEMEAVRKEVADAIFQEKLNEQMDRYIRGLREQAILEIKL